ncbi:2-Hydroxyacid oxidase 1-like [Diadema setosum]|uniref:2-Hydroxyacid oxidase 1-like n=1 Tax=Diadema setosum TaxID=31175 RepID=UPI003B3B2AEE
MLARSKRMCVDDFERDAKQFIEPMMYRYYQGGADEEITLRDSREAFRRYRFRPLVLRDVSTRNLSTTVLGHRIAFPCCISPTALHKGAHPDGELATAKAAASRNVMMSLSCAANVLLEDIAEATPTGLIMMQLWIFKNRQISELLVRRAEKAGFKALMLTVDYIIHGMRRGEHEYNIRQKTRENSAYAKLECVNMNMIEKEVRSAKAAGDKLLWDYMSQADSSATWDDIKWVKRISSIPVVVKGILTGKMAREAAAAGVDGILVSAHGGRQLDSAIAPLDALPEVVEAVRGTNVEVYVDGGVRTGADILKALALGARAAFIGRPAIWGLACGGEDGVKEVLDILKDEFDRAMASAGCADVSCIKRSLVADKNNLSRL